MVQFVELYCFLYGASSLLLDLGLLRNGTTFGYFVSGARWILLCLSCI